MKVLVDTLGAPANSGGMRLYAEELVGAWAETYDDDVVVLGAAWVRDAFAAYPRVSTVVWPNDRAVTRIFGQTVLAGALYWWSRADRLLSVSSMVSPLAPRSRRVCVIHDWRHLRMSDEFSWLRRTYRQLWVSSMNTARAVVTISAKTDDETAVHAPRARRVLIENGRDHPRRWPPSPSTEARDTRIVTFGHHPNKRPHLAIEALAGVGAERRRGVELVVLGATGSDADALRDLARSLDVEQHVSLPGYVDEPRYRGLMQGAHVVMLLSTDEGFGLPVAEAQYFGHEVIATVDSGLDRIHDGLVVASPDGPALADALRTVLDTLPVRDGGQQRASGQRWADTASGIRAVIGVEERA